MKNETKKILLQTSLLVIVFLLGALFRYFITPSPNPVTGGYFVGFWASWDIDIISVFMMVTLLVFLPASFLYLMRKKSIKTLDSIFQGTAYLSSFVMFVFFLVNLFPRVEYNDWQDFSPFLYLDKTLLVSFACLIFAFILYIIARINKSLDEKFSIISITKNTKIQLVVLSILAVISLSFVLWFEASSLATSYFVYDYDFSFFISQMNIKETYQLVFIKIVTLSSFVFISTFLAIKSLLKK